MLRFFYNDNNNVVLPTTLPFIGLYIPYSDLPGTITSDFDPGESERWKEDKTSYSILQKCFNYLSVTPNTLGLLATVSNPVIINPNLLTLTYGLTVDYLINVSSAKVSMIPVPLTGVYSGIGKVSLKNIFPNCFKVLSTADVASINTAGAGILISTEDLANYGFFNDVEGSNLSTINIVEDNRYAISAIYQSLADGNLAIRSTSTASSITSVVVTNAVIREISPSYYSSTNPLSGILAVNLDHLSISRRSYNITFELNLLPQFLEVNTVTL